MRLAAAAAAACALLVIPLAAGATVAATAVQTLSVTANKVDVAFTNTGDETITSFRYVVPGDFRVSAPQVDGASCAVTEAREYKCTGLSVPAGGTWTASFTTPPVYSNDLGFVTPYIPAAGPSTFYLSGAGAETGPFQAAWNGAKQTFDDNNACIVPRVIGKKLAAAKRAITGARCAVGRVTRAWARVPRGRVVRQSPSRGTVLDRLGRVNVVVSRGYRRR